MVDAPKTFEDISLYILEAAEETIRLEFKRELPASTKNDDLAKDLAAMSNSEGGIIIWGIAEDKGRASEVVPFEIARSAERVALVAGGLDEPLRLSNVYSIPEITGASHGVLVAVVPQSQRRPHFHKGVAWARNAKVNYQMSRREIGDMFARSKGFAVEFGLHMGTEGRLRVATRRRERPGAIRGSADYSLVFQNDGETPISNADWSWVIPETRMKTFDNPFPVATMPPGNELEVKLFVSSSSKSSPILLTWTDSTGQNHEETWPISWA